MKMIQLSNHSVKDGVIILFPSDFREIIDHGNKTQVNTRENETYFVKENKNLILSMIQVCLLRGNNNIVSSHELERKS